MAANERKTSTKKRADAPRQKSVLTPAEIEELKALLLTKRRELVGDVNHINDEALSKSRTAASGDLSAMPIHMADIGTDAYDQELALELANGERQMLKKIDEALVRITGGTYGICQGTGKPIPIVRLRAKPWARYCVEFAEQIENGQAEEPQ